MVAAAAAKFATGPVAIAEWWAWSLVAAWNTRKRVLACVRLSLSLLCALVSALWTLSGAVVAP